MNINYFSKVRILDGGMGQHLLAKGLKPKGTLWSATALIDKKYHQLIVDAHLDFIKSGAEVITTNNFSARRQRMIQNNVEEHFNYANEKAGELALKAKEVSKKNILVAGSLPAQNNTYISDDRDKNLIKKNFYDQAKLLKKGIDFFYLDVMSSGLECEFALKAIESYNLPVLVGIHLRDNGKLPSGEKIIDIFKKYKNKNWIGIIMACISPGAYELVINDLQKIDIPYGFKINAFKKIPEGYTVASKDQWGDAGNPNTVLGKNTDLNESKFYEYAKKFKENGATILGGCCEIRPSHIKEISKLK